MSRLAALFFSNTRLLVLAISLVLVAGLSSVYVLPRTEDPRLTERVATITTLFPGADAVRIESLVTEKIEDELREIEEIKELRSASRTGTSFVTIELRDDVYEVDEIWSRVRDRLSDAESELPAGSLRPEFERMKIKAYAAILALKWTPGDQTSELSSANYAILRRYAEFVEDAIRGLPGTEDVELYGDPEEEILVTIAQAELAAIGLSAGGLARQVEASDSKVSAGLLRGVDDDLILEVAGELDSLRRASEIPIHFGHDGRFVRLSDIAAVEKHIAEPPSSLAIVGGAPAICVSVTVRDEYRVDRWTEALNSKMESVRGELPQGLELELVFDQNRYVEARLGTLFSNLLLGGIAVVGVIFFMMGWRSAIIVSSALPLSALMVLTGMRFLGIPIHQMSVTGLIIALGLLIDNAIVMVDDVSVRLRRGVGKLKAVTGSVNHLSMPLLGSTLTTALAFAPIALMPGPAGEFVGSIAISVIMAICSSFLVSMTIIPALTAIGVSSTGKSRVSHWWREGFSSARLTSRYKRSLSWSFSRPWRGALLGVLIPVAGFIQARHLPEQFFPPADRDQFHVEVDLAPNAALQQTLRLTESVRQSILSHSRVKRVDWVLGQSAPPFYYNLLESRENVSSYAQAIVQLDQVEGARELIHELQHELNEQFPQARVLVRQLEQGPPFEAPVEVQLTGPDVERLRALGDEVRGMLASIPNVIHTRADLSQTLPKLMVTVDEEQARLAGLNHREIAEQLNSSLEGAVGGSILEETEELPVRIRVANEHRDELSNIASLDLVREGEVSSDDSSDIRRTLPLEAIAEIELVPEIPSVPHINGQRMNEVKAYIKAGVLPAEVVAAFERRLTDAGFEMPPGYGLKLGGEAAKRDDAIGNLMANVGVLGVLMVATLVLSFGSFRVAGIVGSVAAMSVGLGMFALWLYGFPFGFMAIVGTMGLIGVAINDAIVVLAEIRGNEQARSGDREAMLEVVTAATRHIVATSLTTIAGFTPLVLGGGGFWPPLAVTIAGGVGGATILALYSVPSGYLMLMCRGCRLNEIVGASRPLTTIEHSEQPAVV